MAFREYACIRWGDSLVLFEGPDQALGVPEAHRLDAALDQFMVFEPRVFNFHHLLMPHRLAQGPEIV